MGLTNNQHYKPTNHYIDRAKERFKVIDSMDSMKFFRQHADFLYFVEEKADKNGRKTEVWTDTDVTFVLDVVNKNIVTCYEPKKNPYISGKLDNIEVENKTEQSSEIPLSLFGISQIKSIIFDETFGNTEQSFGKIVEITNKIHILYGKMQSTTRKDYKEKQLAEAQQLMIDITREIKNCQRKENDIKRFEKNLLGE